MATINSNPLNSFRVLVPPVRVTSWTCYTLPSCSIGSLSSKKLFFRSQNRQKFGFRGVSVGKFTINCGITQINQSQFSETVLRSEIPVLVEFVADWCGPCKLISPAIEWASQEYKDRLKIVKIDHDSNPKLIEEYKVYGLPALILFQNGKEIPESRREGAMTKVKLKDYLDSLLDSITVT